MGARFITAFSRLDARIEREISRLRARHQLSDDEFRGLYVSDEHVDQLLAESRDRMPADVPVLLDRPAQGARETDARWRHLVDAFGLSPLQEDLLLIAAAPEFDLKYETLYAYLNDDITRKWPTADLARRLLEEVAEASEVLAEVAPAAMLHSSQLIQRIPQPTARPALLNAGYALQPCVTHWLHGHPPSLALDSDAVRWQAPDALPAFDAVARLRAEPLARILGQRGGRAGAPPVVALLGHSGSGRASTAVAIAVATGRALVRVDLRAAVQSDGELKDSLGQLSVVLGLVPAVVLIEGFDALTDAERRRSLAESSLMATIARWPASSVVAFRTSEEECWRSLAAARRVIEVRCDVHGFADRLELWKQAAQSEVVEISDAALRDFAGRFAFSPGQVRATVATARDLAMMARAEAVGSEQLGAAARLTSDRALGRLAAKIERKHGWADLVLPPATLDRLGEFAAAIRHRHVVYGEWGFGERIDSGTGIKALFAGASGTGKTMAAGVIARELDLDLYKIDLSGVVSKYIGETEKNLDRIFSAARAANAILFLDEAEALMGKRSEVKDAHDRYANIEVAYLLQKLEEHDGIVILATNLKRNIDDAFSRRVQYVIDFPRPGEPERERIWRGFFPPRAPLGADVDFPFLAQQFDLAGGDIRNVALDAAFLAAQNGGVIGMSAVIEALSRQLAKQGKTKTGSDFRQYQRLAREAPDRDAG